MFPPSLSPRLVGHRAIVLKIESEKIPRKKDYSIISKTFDAVRANFALANLDLNLKSCDLDATGVNKLKLISGMF